MPSVIHVANVTKRFGETTAVRDVSFSVPEGQIVGFVGPNGAGKTTLISLLLGFLAPSQGSVSLFGRAVTPATAHRSHRRTGYLAGDMTMFDNLTGAQYLSFMAGRAGIDRRVRERLEGQLSPQLDRRLTKLSRGNKQKIGLIAALQHDPDLIIMDEPTSGLDPLVQEIFLNIIRAEASRGATVFMSSHILSEVAESCDRVVFMKKGRVITDKPITDIMQAAGKILSIEAGPEAIRALTTSLPKGATITAQSDTELTIRYDGDIPQALRWLSTKKLTDLTIENRDLDDIFADTYRDEAGDAA